MSTSSATPSPSSVGSPTAQKGAGVRWIAAKLVPFGLFLAVGIILVIIVGFAQRSGWIRSGDEGAAAVVAAPGEVFTCPMHPQIRQPSPGRCPICGMALVSASNAPGDLDALAIRIEPAQRRLANIQTAVVESGPMEAVLQTVGAIAIDESRQATIAAYIDGRLERLFADYTGVDIKAGDHLAVIYSPQLYAAQVEYLEARRAVGATGGLSAIRESQQALAVNTRQRLHEFGMTDQQLAELENTGKPESRLTIYAPQGGTVVEKLAVEGNYVKAGDPIYRVADLSTVWLMLKLFPEDATRIRFGQRIEATVPSAHGESVPGRIAFIDPTVDIKTRTVGVRVELMNSDRHLRPGDYATARIRLPIGPHGDVFDKDLAGKWISPMHPQIIRDAPGQCPVCGMDLVSTSRYGFATEPVPQTPSLHVPRSAVLMAGANSVVYVETKPGLFEIRPVTVGPILRDRVIIVEGLTIGENVATAGNFLIDSQMQLAGKPSLFDPTRAIAASAKRKGPLLFEQIEVAVIGGEAGQRLEELYAAYVEVQQSLAADKTPAAATAQTLQAAAQELARDANLPASAPKLLQDIAARSEHLSHLDLAGARTAFKPISHAVIALATQVRGEDARSTFTHCYCPMVAGGGGDWLQSGGDLLNPYFGAEMLHCGEKVRELPLQHDVAPESDRGKGPDEAAPKNEGA